MAELTLMKNAAEQQLAAEWQAAKARLPGAAPLRAAAFERFAAAGLPHRRVEEWKYTDLRALMRDAKPLASPPDAAAKARAKDAGGLLADVDAAGSCSSTAHSCRSCPISPTLESRTDHPPDGAGARGEAMRWSTGSARWSRPTIRRSRSTPPSWATAS